MITYKLLTYESNVLSFNSMQRNELWLVLKCYQQTLRLQIIYKMYNEFGIK